MFINEIGNTYNKLTVLRRSARDSKKVYWVCRCECGNEVEVRADSLRLGKIKTCGECSTNTFYEHPDGYMVGVTTKGQEFFFDIEDYEKVKCISWFPYKDKISVYIAGKLDSNTQVMLHRYVLGLTSYDNKLDVDHKNHITIDNRRQNLRVCTHRENMMNQKVTKGKSKYKGVSYRKSSDKWVARISDRVTGKRIHLGYYSNEVEAALEYNKAAIEHYGEFAYLNKIQLSDEG